MLSLLLVLHLASASTPHPNPVPDGCRMTHRVGTILTLGLRRLCKAANERRDHWLSDPASLQTYIDWMNWDPCNEDERRYLFLFGRPLKLRTIMPEARAKEMVRSQGTIPLVVCHAGVWVAQEP